MASVSLRNVPTGENAAIPQCTGPDPTVVHFQVILYFSLAASLLAAPVLSAQVPSPRVGSPYQSLICMKYTNVLWLSALGDYLHLYPCDLKSESSPLRHDVSTQIVRKGVETSRMEDVDHLPS